MVSAESGLELKYDQCLIATGATPVMPPIEGINSDRIYTMRTVEDAIRLKEAMTQRPRKPLSSALPWWGSNSWNSFIRQGWKSVWPIWPGTSFLMAAHPECAGVIEERLNRKGIQLRFGAGIEKVEETARGVRASFKDSTQSEEADLLVMCIGVRANTGFVDRKQVDVDRGILVDEHMRTNVPGLYAAGDVAQGENLLSGRPEIIGLWGNARSQGRTAGRNMAGGNEVFRGNIPHNMTHFLGMDFVGIGDVNNPDRMEKKYDGKRYIQFFWKEGLLTGANFCGQLHGIRRHQKCADERVEAEGALSPGGLPMIQNH